jgi:carboxylesterase
MTEYVQRLRHVVKKHPLDVPDEMRSRYERDINLINRPFHLKGTSDTCVVLAHGWTSTPYEMRVLGEQLNHEGFGVDAPLLTGHGVQPELLENIPWQQWVTDIEKAYLRVKKQYKKVYVGGMSMGGNLALHVAAENKDVDGVILMSTPYSMRWEKVGYYIASAVRPFKKYKSKYYPRSWRAQPSITQLISYQRYPISSAFEAFAAIKESLVHLDKITQPIFIIQPEHDHLVSKKSVSKLYKTVNSEKKEMRYIKRANHNFMGNGEHMDVFHDVVDFVKKN